MACAETPSDQIASRPAPTSQASTTQSSGYQGVHAAFYKTLGDALKKPEDPQPWLAVAINALQSKMRWQGYAALRRYQNLHEEGDPERAGRILELGSALLELPASPSPDEAIALFQAEHAVQQMQQALSTSDSAGAKTAATDAITAFRKALANPAVESAQAWQQMASAILVADDKSQAIYAEEGIRRLNPGFYQQPQTLAAVGKLDQSVNKDALNKLQATRYEFELLALRSDFELGQCDACASHLADAFVVGAGVMPDPPRAVELWKTAARHQYNEAFLRLGNCYEKGLGVPADFEEAVKWFELGLKGEVRAVWAGIRTAPLSEFPAYESHTGFKGLGGALIIRSLRSGPNYNYIKPGDNLIAIDGVSIDPDPTGQTVIARIKSLNPDQQHTAVVYRAASEIAIPLRLTESEPQVSADDINDEIEWLKSITNLGDAAVYRYIAGIYSGSNASGQVASFLQGAARKDGYCMAALVQAYHTGFGTAVDEKKSLSWADTAANSGNPAAIYNVGLLYYQGRYVPKDKEKGLRLLYHAADLGNAGAMRCVGDDYLVQEHFDSAKAREWYSKAVEAGDAYAMVRLGELYYYKVYGVQDSVRAFKLFKDGAAKGIAMASTFEANCYYSGEGTEKDCNKALRCAYNAVSLGDETAGNLIGIIYLNGLGVSQSDAHAIAWFTRAANAGSTASMQNLGGLYSVKGKNYSDEAMARKYYIMAADAGNEVAKKWLTDHPAH